MFCLQCGAKNDDDSRFCYQCGAPMMKKSEPARKRKKIQEEEPSGWDANDFMAEEEPLVTESYSSNETYDANDDAGGQSMQNEYTYDRNDNKDYGNSGYDNGQYKSTGYDTAGYDETVVISGGVSNDNISNMSAASGGSTMSDESDAVNSSTMPNMNSMPDSNTMSNMNSMPNSSTMPNMNSMPDSSTMSNMYGMPNGNTMPNMGSAPGGNTMSNMYGMPDGNVMQNMNGMYGYPQQGAAPQNAPKVLTGGRAFGIMCLNFLHCIPLLGTVVWLIIMIIFACSGKKDPNRAGMCKGVLIWFLVPLIIIIILLLVFGSSITAVLSEAGLI